jgi:hypothetical protein
MKNGRCPKYNTQEVYSGAHISIKGGSYGSNTIPLGGVFARQIALDNYVCCNCGYLESYISKPIDLKRIRTTWEKV